MLPHFKLCFLLLCFLLSSTSADARSFRSVISPLSEPTCGNPVFVSKIKSKPALGCRGGAKKEKQAKVGGTASVSSEIFNLVKTIVGVGVLSLPSGIAAFGNNPSAAVPALGLIAIIGILSGFGFSTIGRVCKYDDNRALDKDRL